MIGRRTTLSARSTVAGVISLIAVVVAATSVAATDPGKLDPSFSGDGYTHVGFGRAEGADAIFRDAKGRYVLIGGSAKFEYTDKPGFRFALTRLTPGGTIDQSYGTDGRTTFDPTAGFEDIAVAAGMGPGGKPVVLGSRRDNNNRSVGFVLARFTPAGKVDGSFGGDGVVTGTLGAHPGSQGADDVLVLPDGRVLVLGYADSKSVLKRLKADGNPDLSFGDAGRIQFGRIRGGSLLRRPDGRIVVIGTVAELTEFRARRFLPGGAPDLSFGVGGVASMALDVADIDGLSVAAAALAPSGRIYAVGMAMDNATFHSDAIVAAFTAQGEPATGFSGDGWRRVDWGNVDQLAAVAVAADGNVVAAGGSWYSIFDDEDPRPGQVVLALLHPDGSLDADFGDGGKVLTPIAHGAHPPGTDFAIARGIVLEADRLVIAGTSGGTNYADFLAARYSLQ